MTKKAKSRLHFGGIWKLDHDYFAEREAAGEELEPTVLFFLGDDFLLVTVLGDHDGTKVTDLNHAGYIYDVEPKRLLIWPTGGKGKRPKVLEWRFVNRRYLELKEKGHWLKYVPSSLDDMEEIGVPRTYFETWVDTFEKQGSFAILRPLVPEFDGK
jgi:hypothetical protein